MTYWVVKVRIHRRGLFTFVQVCFWSTSVIVISIMRFWPFLDLQVVTIYLSPLHHIGMSLYNKSSFLFYDCVWCSIYLERFTFVRSVFFDVYRSKANVLNKSFRYPYLSSDHNRTPIPDPKWYLFIFYIEVSYFYKILIKCHHQPGEWFTVVCSNLWTLPILWCFILSYSNNF